MDYSNMDYSTFANLVLYSNDHWVSHNEVGYNRIKEKKRYFCRNCHCEVDYYQDICYDCEMLEGIKDDQ